MEGPEGLVAGSDHPRQGSLTLELLRISLGEAQAREPALVRLPEALAVMLAPLESSLEYEQLLVSSNA